MSCMRKRGGAATVMPMEYYNPSYSLARNVSAGRDLLHASGRGIRPSLGGRRKRRSHHSKKRSHRSKRRKGGFVPSVMGSFVESASKYIVPLALYAGYKLMTRKGKKGKKSTRRSRK